MDDLTKLSDHELGGCMQLRLEHRPDVTDPDRALIEEWWATGVLTPTDVDGDPAGPEVEVVHARLVRCQPGTPDLWMTLDDMEADSGVVGSVVLDPDT